MSAPTLLHTPYATSRKPFSIGLAPIDAGRWFEPDGGRDTELARKDELLATRPEVTIHSGEGTEAAQREVLALLADFLAAHPSGDYFCHAGGMRIGAERFVAFERDEPAIVTASRLVQDDLCLMRRGESGWRLAAASVCFPSNWSLRQMAGAPLAELHRDVPGYAGAMQTRMDRIFDNLPVAHIVERLNWSIADDGDFHKPYSKAGRKSFGEIGRHFGENAFVRVERQTLRRMPVSRDILFTIKIHADPLHAFRSHPDGARLALALREQISGLDGDQLVYKGMDPHRDALMAGLAGIAAEIGEVRG